VSEKIAAGKAESGARKSPQPQDANRLLQVDEILLGVDSGRHVFDTEQI